MKFSKKEAEIIVHRLEVPDCIYEVLSDSGHDPAVVTQEAVDSSCQRLTNLVTGGKEFDTDNELDRLVLVESIQGSVLPDDRHMRIIRIKVGLDKPAERQPAAKMHIPTCTKTFAYSDGGRAAAGYKGHAGDCVARAIAIASGLPYKQVYDRLAIGNATQRKSKRSKVKGRSARNGVYTGRKWFNDYMAELGFVWTPTMHIGSGCKVHLKADELPGGTIIASITRHLSAVIDGVIHDTSDPSRGGTRCVYGYWRKP